MPAWLAFSLLLFRSALGVSFRESNDFVDIRSISTLAIWCRRRQTMNMIKNSAIGFVVGSLILLPVGLQSDRGDDDPKDRWEDYQEELEDRREEERERYEEWLEDREEALEDAREEGAVVVPHRVVVPERSVVVPERTVVVPERSAAAPNNWRPRNRQTRYWQYEETVPRQYQNEEILPPQNAKTLPPPRRYTQ